MEEEEENIRQRKERKNKREREIGCIEGRKKKKKNEW